MSNRRSPKRSEPIDHLVGRRICLRRREIEVSQDFLAKRLGVSFQQIQKYEQGTNRISVGRLVEIAVALETTVSDLLAGAEALLDEKVRLEVEASPGDRAMLYDAIAANLSADTPNMRSSILRQVQNMARSEQRRS